MDEDIDNVLTMLADRGAGVAVDDGQSEMESALESVAQTVCESWEVFGSDSEMSVVTDVDGHLVRLTVSVELLG